MLLNPDPHSKNGSGSRTVKSVGIPVVHCSILPSSMEARYWLIRHGMIRIATSCWWCCGTWCTPTPRCESSWCRRPLTRPSSHPTSATVPLLRSRAALSPYRFGLLQYFQIEILLYRTYCSNKINFLLHKILWFLLLLIGTVLFT